jgi:hypothetical protein
LFNRFSAIVFLFSILWMIVAFSIWWPGVLSDDAIDYLDELLITQSSIKDFSEETYLYAALMKFSVMLTGNFSFLIILQFTLAAFLIAIFCDFQNRILKNPLWCSLIAIGSIFIPTTSMMLLSVERDVLFVWSLIWICILQLKIIFFPIEVLERRNVFLQLGLALVLCSCFKQIGFFAIPVVFFQIFILKFPKREYVSFGKSFLSFGFCFYALFPLLLGVKVAQWPIGIGYFSHLKSFKMLYEPGFFYAPQVSVGIGSLENSFGKIQYARNQGIISPPNYPAISRLKSSYENIISKLRLDSPPRFGSLKNTYLEILNWLNVNQWRFYFLQSFLLGEFVLLFLILGAYWIPKTSLLALLPISQYLMTFLLQPVGKGRYFYFIFLVPFFFIPIAIYELKTRKKF